MCFGFRGVLIAASTGLCLFVVPAVSDAQASGLYVSMAPSAAASRAGLALEVGTGRTIDLHRPAANVFVANPKIVDVRPASSSTFFVFGLSPGRSTVAALDGSGRQIASFDVMVKPSSYAAAQAKSVLADQVPGNGIGVQATMSGLVASGTVATPQQALDADAALRSALPKGAVLNNNINVKQSMQVLLRVRVAEMSRAVTRQMGVNWQAVGTIVKQGIAQVPTAAAFPAASFAVGYFNHGINVNALIDALAEDNSAHLLAEPDLMAMSGEPANFLVGGEYPVPVSSSLGQVNVTYKEYGVKLDFVPTVMNSGRIQLHVRPEVSALSSQGAVQTGTGSTAITIPALTVRRADTTVELGSGQSFAIAGMLQKNVTQDDTGLPGLGDVPVIGGLFRTDNYQRSETELVIIVTPYLVQPVSDPGVLKTPDPDFVPPNDLERLLLLRQASLRTATRATGVFPSEAGFIVK